MTRGNKRNAAACFRCIGRHGSYSISTHDNVWKQIRSELYQLRFILFRLRFHVVEGLHYLVEASRWKRRLAALHGITSPNLIVD